MADDETEDAAMRPGADALAAQIAMGAGAETAAEARAYLRKQSLLVDLQIEELRKEDRVRHWALRVRHVNELLKLAFGLSGALIALILAAGLSALVWNAYDARGLIIEPIRTPPDLAARGLDGTVLAQRLLDKLNGLVSDADKWSFRAADSIGGNWGDDSKVEIPETGVSVFELSRFLRRSLGHETAMSGELYHTASGIALTVRVGSAPGTTFQGGENDVDKLLSRAAESLLAQTQPYRYVWMLYAQGRPAEVVAPIARRFVEEAPDTERPWLQGALEQQLEFSGRFREGSEIALTTIAYAPRNPTGYIDRAAAEWPLGHLEQAYRNIEAARQLLSGPLPKDFAASAVPFLIANCMSFEFDVSGAFGDAVAADFAELKTGQFDFDISGPAALANDYALSHDVGAARAVLAKYRLLRDEDFLTPEFVVTTGPDLPNFYVRVAIDDWTGARDALERTDRATLLRNNVNDVRHTLIWPWLAYAWTRTGRLHDAQGLIAKTPLDCTLCLEMRGRVAEAAGNKAAAVYWFGRAIDDAPSIPFSYTDWGRLRVRNHDIAGAIALYRAANLKSPHYADALELWGEALMLENRSDLAIAKFADAGKHAPNWGRLRMKWGEALGYVGRKAESADQYRLAWALYLSAADRTELLRDLAVRTAQNAAVPASSR
jgi:tetratricopeptide (TPR) repeat protein